MKKLENEVVISALLQHGTIKDTAAALKISPRAIQDRMKEAEFSAAYMEARNDVLRAGLHNLNSKVGAAIEEIASIMQDKEVNAAIRLQAAQTILTHAGKFADRLAHDEFESRQANDPFSLSIL